MPSILPSAQGKRITEPNTVHHLISRIAHRVFFLQEDERNDFVEMMRRVAGFTGIRLVGWCIMTNHFHILALLPEPEDLSELEIIRRYSLIHSKEDTATLVSELARFRASGPEGEQNVAWRLREIRKMMFSISWFMKILKEWFSKDYNGRTSHKGTLWEATYTDRPVRYNIDDMSFRLSYIHLNPYRAGLVTDFDSYCWSSLNAAVRGDVLALEGLHLVYGEECGAEEMLAEHHLRMAAALELGKRKRARDVAKLRRAGYMPKADALIWLGDCPRRKSSPEEIEGLISWLPEKGVFVEVVTLFGLTAKAIAAAKPGLKVVAVDNFSWNPFGLPPQAHEAFTRRILDQEIRRGQIEILNTSSAQYRNSTGVPGISMESRPDAIFFDAQHQ